MCQFCDSDPIEKQKARQHAHRVADELQKMSNYYKRMADNRIKLHSEEMRPVTLTAHRLIRELVEEWI
jgi:hypothetical protein